MNKTNFLKAMKVLSENFGLQVSDGYSELMCKMLNFTDKQIEKALNVLSSQKTMNKMPSMAQWKEAAGIDIRTPVDIACDNFLAKVKGYLSAGFVSSEEKLEFSKGLSEVERRILSNFGGISVLWQDCHREEYNRNISVLLNQLKKEFDNNATEENIKLPPKDTVSIENKTKTVSQDKIKELLENSIKRIS
jgi:hypothetical protein